MDNHLNIEQDRSQQHKAELKAKLEHTRVQIRQDLNELKDDLNPLKTAGTVIKNMLKPAPEAQLTNSGLVNFGIDAGISLLVGRFFPGANKTVIKVMAPVLIKNLATHIVPRIRRTAETTLEWVVEKTNKPEEKYLADRKIQREPSTYAD